MAFRQAAPVALRARISIEGLSGAGKTTTALRIAQGLVAGSDKRIAGICTEQGRMQLESRWCDFDISILEPHQLGPEDLAREIVASYGHGVLVIDSMSAAWAAILQIKDATTSAKEAYTGWGKINPRLEKLTHAILKHPGHVIACFRSKMKHEIVEQNGKKEVRKLGVEPIARPGAEYDFDLSIELDHQHIATLAKPARGLYAEAFPEHWRCERPGVEVGETIRRCLEGDQPTPVAQHGAMTGRRLLLRR